MTPDSRLPAAVHRIAAHLKQQERPELAGLIGISLQVHKVQEEAGELAGALIGVTGQNTRKGVTHTWNDVLDEALDVLMAAAVLVENVAPGEFAGLLGARLDFLEQRLGITGTPAGPPPAAAVTP